MARVTSGRRVATAMLALGATAGSWLLSSCCHESCENAYSVGIRKNGGVALDRAQYVLDVRADAVHATATCLPKTLGRLSCDSDRSEVRASIVLQSGQPFQLLVQIAGTPRSIAVTVTSGADTLGAQTFTDPQYDAYPPANSCGSDCRAGTGRMTID